MTNKIIDLRSDTLTRPTAAMREAMAGAEVGDDVFDEDPTIHRLQDHVAQLLGKEAALYVPSGSMSNQIGVRVHCRPGDELLCELGCHIYKYEQGAYAQLNGVVAHTIQGGTVEEPGCILRLEQLQGLIHGSDEHLVRTRLVCLENTHNHGGGRVLPYDGLVEICQWARQNSLRTHLDGARLFNAVIATGIAASDWAGHFDTVSVCFSKGLGAPVGSALAGSRELIQQARRHRKLFGGGMRQAGVIAAGALYALEHHIDRLAEDHATAKRLAETIRRIDGFELRPEVVDTNIVFFYVEPRLGTSKEICAQLKELGLLMLPLGPTLIRAVTHLDVSMDDVSRACEIMRQLF